MPTIAAPAVVRKVDIVKLAGIRRYELRVKVLL